MRSKTPILATVAAVVAAVALTACGSSSGSGPSSGGTATSSNTSSPGGRASGKKIDVCKIVTAADAQKVIGGPVQEQAPAGTEGLAAGVCIYKGTGGGIRVSLLQVRVYSGPQFYGEQALDNTKSIDIPGTDKAFSRSAAGGKNVDVQFVKDGKTGAVNFTDTGSTAPEATTIANVEAVARTLAAGI
jgi:hypothetical protein